MIDGVTVGSIGDSIYNAGEADVTNDTTGETGRFLYITINGGTITEFVGYASTVPINIGDNFTLSNFTAAADEAYTNIVPCFTAGTMISTPDGDMEIQNLKAGDMVLTANRGPQKILWMGSRKLSGHDLKLNSNLRPICVAAGALGANIPSADLIVSPQHRILVRSKIAQKMFGTDEVLVAAKQLCQLDGINIIEDATNVEYFHFMFEQHEVVIANGAETESLFTGPEALKSVGPAARKEILSIFPELKNETFEPVAARFITSGRLGRKLAVRHQQNEKALVI
ncbi:hemolysin [Paracoccus sp. JM45]|nr:hemolysin [Paracoccus sp. JM45]